MKKKLSKKMISAIKKTGYRLKSGYGVTRLKRKKR
jgi:hypothetical protein